MKKPKKGKYPSKPKLKKLPKKPKYIKGGIKTQAQLDSWNVKKADYLKKVNGINTENKKKTSAYETACKKIDTVYNKEMKAYNAFKAKVEKAKKI